MIQDIWPDIYHNEFDPDAVMPDPEDTVLMYRGRSVLCRMDEAGGPVFPAASELTGQDGHAAGAFTYLFSITVRSEKGPERLKRYFLYTPDEETEDILPGYGFENLRILRNPGPKRECFAAETGYHLALWYKNNRYCGRCASKTQPSKTERALVCPDCGNTVYPRISPAVIVGVTRGDKLLMSRYAGREFADFALIAGFCEIGETVEQTVQREVMEEVGLKVSNIRYYKSQPWGFDGGLLMGFYCDADGPDEIRVDKNELSEAAFYDRESIVGQRVNDISLTSEMMLCFRDGKEPK
ncbi:MAG: NAD(+) diphosphatase [Lachnospiraceae bacterium]|nr:NAD(+) diphosphatase [Lachnospiraceae bacterium]